MAATLRRDADAPMTDINITPFVDIILVVLIAFMVTSTVVASEQIPIELPSGATGVPVETTSLAVALTTAGRLYLNGEPSDPLDVRRAIRAAHARGADVSCLIGADGSVPHRDVMDVVDLVRQEGVDRFGIQVIAAPMPDEAELP